ncbi:MAG: hypothetical protein LBH00_06585 [Planctomycetaceae bacterium]|jgi:hypothetical protein|nr:hypothetical protein [Planctomycetaceae bacterium]
MTTFFKDIWNDDPLTIPADFQFIVEFVRKYGFLQQMGPDSITDFVCSTEELGGKEHPVIQEFYQFGLELQRTKTFPRWDTWCSKRYDLRHDPKLLTYDPNLIRQILPHDDFEDASDWIMQVLDDLDGRYEWGGILNTGAELN